jgi:Nucleotidyl transferase AbiEii toxin, Type IV TA system
LYAGPSEVSSAAMQFDEVLRTWKGFFEREGVRYALIGGLAMRAWGSARTTHDVDFVVDSAARDRVVSFAEEQGFKTIHMSEAYSNHERGSDYLDFMYVEPSTANQIFAAAEERTAIGDLPLNVARPEHLAAMKAIAIRSAPRRAFRDMSDVGFLLRLPGVDRQFIREYFERKGMLEVFDEIEKRT